jgi:putative transposase
LSPWPASTDATATDGSRRCCGEQAGRWERTECSASGDAKIDEYTRECLALRVERRLNSLEVIDTLADVMLVRGVPEHIRSDNGPEFIARKLQNWLARVGTKTLYIERGSPWENGYCESFNGKLRDECLNGEIFYSLKEAQIVIESWRVEYNTERPHSALGYRPPAPVAAFRPAAGALSQARAVM